MLSTTVAEMALVTDRRLRTARCGYRQVAVSSRPRVSVADMHGWVHANAARPHATNQNTVISMTNTGVGVSAGGPSRTATNVIAATPAAHTAAKAHRKRAARLRNVSVTEATSSPGAGAVLALSDQLRQA